MQNNLAILSDRSIHATYFVTADVSANYPGFMEELKKTGGEIGVHLHPEQVLKGAGSYKHLKLYSAETQRKLIRDSLQALSEYRPVSFRAGRLSADKTTLRILEELGFSCDSSVYPQSVFPDSADAFHPRLDGERLDILEIPVTCQNSTLMRISRHLGPRLDDRMRDAFIFSPILIKKAGKTGLKVLKLRYDRTRKEHDIAVFLMHSWDFLDKTFSDNLASLLDHIVRRGDGFSRMRDIKG